MPLPDSINKFVTQSRVARSNFAQIGPLHFYRESPLTVSRQVAKGTVNESSNTLSLTRKHWRLKVRPCNRFSDPRSPNGYKLCSGDSMSR